MILKNIFERIKTEINLTSSLKYKSQEEQIRKILADYFTEIEKNDCWYDDTFKYQPFGSQKTPDFIIYTNKKFISIEAKSSKSSNKITWNSGLPQDEIIYVFTNKNLETTFCLGDQFISKEEKDLFDSYNNECKIITEKYKKIFKSKGSSWTPYHRPMHNMNKEVFPSIDNENLVYNFIQG
jgi:hypothetical protein